MTFLSNLDLFEDLVNFIKEPTNNLEEILKEYGGSTFYIPSYKTIYRNEQILKDYIEHQNKPGIYKELSRKYEITERQIQSITKPIRDKRRNT